MLDLRQELEALRAAKKEINARLREVYQAVRSMEGEQHQAAQDAGPR